MTTALKPYPAYRGSGIPWLKQIPHHWEALALRHLGTKFGSGLTPRGGATRYVATGVLFLRSQNVHFAGLKLDDVAHITEQDDADMSNSRVLPQDVLLNITGASLGRACVVPSDIGRANVNQHVCIIRPMQGKVQPKYLSSYLRSNAIQAFIQQISTGAAREGLALDELKAIPVLLPPLDEQRAIADFLDVMDARISRFIAAKRRMIALLEEKKQAVINQAVTRGLDPGVPLKDSGVGSLGKIPAHWDVRRMKGFLREVDERSESGAEELLSVSHLTGVTPRSEKNITMFRAESYVGHKLCQPGDVVANTMWLWMGAIGVSRNTGIVSPSYAVYRRTSNSVALPDYLDLLLRTRPYVSEYHRQSTGIRSSRLRLYPDQFLRMKVALPDLAEQHRILQRIGEDTANLSAVWDRARREIELIREYSTRLISDVVTGKLDVRCAELPEIRDIAGNETEAVLEHEV